jgi:hypothetical protein
MLERPPEASMDIPTTFSIFPIWLIVSALLIS